MFEKRFMFPDSKSSRITVQPSPTRHSKTEIMDHFSPETKKREQRRYSVKHLRAKGQSLRMLLLWRGSVYKMVWKEVIVWLIIYFTLNLIYRFALDDVQKRQLEDIVTDIERGIAFVPLTFALGFYLQLVLTRYWQKWENLPRPKTLALRIAGCVTGKALQQQQLRRTAMRQINLTLVLALRKLSSPVQTAFPDLESLVAKGLMTREEQKSFRASQPTAEFPEYWIPLMWASAIFDEARRQNMVANDFAWAKLQDELADFRRNCDKTLQTEVISIPLSYSQVVIIACYTFYLGSIVARQAVTASIENYFPFFTILQLIIFIGWMKIAESMIHPFGDDDDDFDLVAVIDETVRTTYKMVDTNDGELPEAKEDPYWQPLRDGLFNPSTPHHEKALKLASNKVAVSDTIIYNRQQQQQQQQQHQNQPGFFVRDPNKDALNLPNTHFRGPR